MGNWIKRDHGLTFVLVCAMLAGIAANRAGAGETGGAPSAVELKDRMIAAYRQAKTYQADINFQIEQKAGRITQIMRQDLHVVLDRAGNRLMIDAPEWIIASSNDKLILKVRSWPNIHMEISTPANLDYDALLKEAPVLNSPTLRNLSILPDVALLLGSDPIKTAIGTDSAQPQLSTDGGGLIFHTPLGRVVELVLDPDTHLVTSATITADQSGPVIRSDRYLKLTYTFKIKTSSIDDTLFSVDTIGSVAHSSFGELAQASRAAAQNPRGMPNLEGKTVGPIRLATVDDKIVDLAKLDSQVIVLDFWATWCGPCRRGLAALQKVYDWADKENKSVSVFAVNQQDTKQDVRDYWKKNGLSLPILMDPNQVVGRQFGAHIYIPVTVIINQGKVATIHNGVPTHGDYTTTLKKEIQALLN